MILKSAKFGADNFQIREIRGAQFSTPRNSGRTIFKSAKFGTAKFMRTADHLICPARPFRQRPTPFPQISTRTTVSPADTIANEWYSSTPFTLTHTLADAFEIAQRVVFFNAIQIQTQI
jgi:hypothetical protein